MPSKLSRDERQEHHVVAAAERRLARLRFDLHDGPQQDLMLLAEDVRLFRSQLATVLAGHEMRDRMVGRVDDVEARLVALDADLRRLSSALQSPFLPTSLPDALKQLTDDFSARTGVEPQLTLEGESTQLTDSQQITLLGLIREALSNIREHSGAKHVSITVAVDGNAVEASVVDDGRGFEPETTLVEAARQGHLGLVSMHERVRLLGGHTRIDSRPGGPTVISAVLPSGKSYG
jgi:signal transduction histidine kinase